MMHPEIARKFQEIIEANIASGFIKGQDLFAESLNEDIQKATIIEGVTIDGVMDYLLSDLNN